MLGTEEYPEEHSKYGKVWRGVFEKSAVEHVKLPSTLRKMEYSVFDECENLKKIELSEGLEYIGKWCFRESGLEDIMFPSSVKNVGAQAFYDCK